MRSVVRVATVAAAVLAATGANAANLIANGSFETTVPAVPAGSFQTYLSGDTTGLPGWTVTGPIGVAAFGLTSLAMAATSTEGVVQTVSTIPGDHYELSFWVGNTSDKELVATKVGSPLSSSHGVGVGTVHC
jgi:hypothetical protein